MPYSCAKIRADANSADFEVARSPTILIKEVSHTVRNKVGTQRLRTINIHINLEESIQHVDASWVDIFLAEWHNFLHRVVRVAHR